MTRKPPPDLAVAGGLGPLIVVVLFALGALTGAPLNDDFSYARTAEVFARSGHIVYNGWGSPILLPQIYVGALLIQLFGFSYLVLDLFGIACAAVATALMFLLARACGLSVGLATLATLVLTLNPVFLGVAPTFMTDIPSLALLLAALLLLVNALRKETVDRRLFFAAVALGAIGGANRQILWVAFLGALTAVFALVPTARRLAGIGAGAIVLVAGALTLWFGSQPFTVTSGYGEGIRFIQSAPAVAFLYVYKFLSLLALFLLPVLAPALLRRRTYRFLLLGGLAVFALAPMLVFGPLLFNEYRLTAYGQYVTASGVLVGGVDGFEKRPMVFGGGVIVLLVVVGAAALAAGGSLFLDWWERRGSVAVSVVAAASAIQIVASLPWYGGLSVFDRYLLLVLPGLLILHAAQVVPSRKTLLVGGALAAVLALVGLLFASEYFAYTRARATLYHRLVVEKRVPREQIDGGFEYNADTQVLLGKFVNNRQITNPPDAYRADASGRGLAYRPEVFPALDARYRLSTDPSLGLPVVDQIQYAAPWPFGTRTMTVYEVRSTP